MLSRNLNLFFSIVKARLVGKYVPFSVQFSVTSRCNSKCSYCYAKYYQRAYKDLDTKTCKKIISGLAKLGTKRLSLVGGEPLVRHDIDKLISYTRKKGMECVMTTNGYLVPALADSLKKLDLLVFSLDGREKNHDGGREKGSWKKTMTGLETAYKAGIPLQVSTVLTKKNLGDLSWLAQLGKKYNLWISFTPLINQSGKDNKLPIDYLLPSKSQYRRVFSEIIKMKKQGAPFLYHEKIYKFILSWPDFKIDKMAVKPDFAYFKCQAGRYTGIIDSNGDFYPCPQLLGELKVKNILKDGLAKSWKHINNHGCITCPSPCYNNLSLIFSLDPEVLWELSKSYRGAK